MAKCELRIELDRASFAPGECIEGAVVVQVDEACHCNQLKVSLVFETHGKGSNASTEAASDVVFHGDWPGGERAYRFALQGPSVPETYRGETLNVDWRVEATADIPWAFDPKVHRPITIASPYDRGLVLRIDESRLANQRSGRGCGLVAIGVFTLVGMGLLVAGVIEETIGAMIGGAIWTLILITMLISAIRKLIADGKMNVTSYGARLVRGEGYRDARQRASIECRVRMSPKVVVDQITAKLVVRERVIRGSGSNKRTYTHVLHSDETELVRAGADVAGSIPVPEPGRAPYSFTSSKGAIDWRIVFEATVGGTRFWSEEVPVQAEPEPGTASPGIIS